MLVLPQQMAQVEAFVASLPPAVVQLLSLLYDNNSELSQQLMARNNTIQQLKLAHAVALDQRDQQLEELRARLLQLQQQDAQEPQTVVAAATAPAQPASPSAAGLQAQHADAGEPAASTKRSRAAVQESEDQLASAAAELPPLKHVHLSTPSTPGASAPAAQQEAAAAASQTAAAVSPARSMRVLAAGTFKLGGSKSPTEPPAHQQQQPAAGQADTAMHTNEATAAAPAACDDQAEAAGAVSSPTAPGTGQQQQQQQQQEPQLPAVPAAGSDPCKAAPQNPSKPAVAAEPFDPQKAYAFVNEFLQKHKSLTTSSSTGGRAPSSSGGAPRGPSSTGGAPRGPSSTGGASTGGGSTAAAAGAAAAAAAAPGLIHSDGGSAATAFDPAQAAQYVSRQLARLSGGGMQGPVNMAGAAGAAVAGAGAGAGARRAASAGAQVPDLAAYASQLLAAGLPFDCNAASHRGQVPAAGYGLQLPHMYDPSAAMQQHMLGHLPGYTQPVNTGQHRAASAQPPGYAAAVAAGQHFGVQQRPFSATTTAEAAAAAAAGASGGGLYSGYGAGAGEGWQQHPGSMMAAAAAAAAAAGQSGAAAAAATAFWDQLSGPLPTQAGAAGHRQDGNTGANRRSLRLLSSSGDEQAPSLGEAARQKEIERQVPAAVQDSIRANWMGLQPQHHSRLLPVTCNGVFGTFFLDSGGEVTIRTAGGQEMRPAQFERECGRVLSKDPWRTIKVLGYVGKNGPIQLGQFCRIAGIHTGRRSSSA